MKVMLTYLRNRSQMRRLVEVYRQFSDWRLHSNASDFFRCHRIYPTGISLSKIFCHSPPAKHLQLLHSYSQAFTARP